MRSEVIGGANFDHITQDAAVLAGRATVRGLRISVAHVFNLVATGMMPAQIVVELAPASRILRLTVAPKVFLRT
jgi:uncharacterized protein (DUF433 family)